jgi:hypothetical protein
LVVMVEGVAAADRHRWSEVSERKFGWLGLLPLFPLLEKAEVEKRDEKGFLLLPSEKPES